MLLEISYQTDPKPRFEIANIIFFFLNPKCDNQMGIKWIIFSQFHDI